MNPESEIQRITEIRDRDASGIRKSLIQIKLLHGIIDRKSARCDTPGGITRIQLPVCSPGAVGLIQIVIEAGVEIRIHNKITEEAAVVPALPCPFGDINILLCIFRNLF